MDRIEKIAKELGLDDVKVTEERDPKTEPVKKGATVVGELEK